MRTAIVTLVILLLCWTAPAHAQEQKNELSITAGVGSFQDIVNGIGDIGTLIFTLGYFHTETNMVTPVIGVHYKRHLNHWMSLGGTFNYQRYENTYYFKQEEIGSTDLNYYTFMARMDVTYLRRPIVQLYSGLSAGLSAATESGNGVESDSVYWFAFQLNAIGVRIGKQLAAIVELGFGYNGVLGAGVNYSF